MNIDMSGLYLLKPTRSTVSCGPHWISLDKNIASTALIGTNSIYMRPPYTIGNDEICMRITVRLVQYLLEMHGEGIQSTCYAGLLKEVLDNVTGQLVSDDIGSVMCTVRDIVAEMAWDKIQSSFLIFLRNDYCKDFFEEVCLPAKNEINISKDKELFTVYQHLLGSRSKITNVVKKIINRYDKKHMDAMVTKRCFIRFYVHNIQFNTNEDFLEGMIIDSFLHMYANTQ